MKRLDPVLAQSLGRPVWGCSSFRKGFRMCASRKGRDEAPGTARKEEPGPGSSAYHPAPHTQGITRAMRTGPWTLAMAGVAVCGLSLLSLGLKRCHLSPRTWGESI